MFSTGTVFRYARSLSAERGMMCLAHSSPPEAGWHTSHPALPVRLERAPVPAQLRQMAVNTHRTAHSWSCCRPAAALCTDTLLLSSQHGLLASSTGAAVQHMKFGTDVRPFLLPTSNVPQHHSATSNDVDICVTSISRRAISCGMRISRSCNVSTSLLDRTQP